MTEQLDSISSAGIAPQLTATKGRLRAGCDDVCASDNLFARTRFARNQHWEIGPGDTSHQLHHLHESVAASNQVDVRNLNEADAPSSLPPAPSVPAPFSIRPARKLWPTREYV